MSVNLLIGLQGVSGDGQIVLDLPWAVVAVVVDGDIRLSAKGGNNDESWDFLLEQFLEISRASKSQEFILTNGQRYRFTTWERVQCLPVDVERLTKIKDRLCEFCFREAEVNSERPTG